jgi:hypothetical protein
MGVFGGDQSILPPRVFRAALALLLTTSIAVLAAVVLIVTGYVMASPTFGWTGTAISSPWDLQKCVEQRDLVTIHTDIHRFSHYIS